MHFRKKSKKKYLKNIKKSTKKGDIWKKSYTYDNLKQKTASFYCHLFDSQLNRVTRDYIKEKKK